MENIKSTTEAIFQKLKSYGYVTSIGAVNGQTTLPGLPFDYIAEKLAQQCGAENLAYWTERKEAAEQGREVPEKRKRAKFLTLLDAELPSLFEYADIRLKEHVSAAPSGAVDTFYEPISSQTSQLSLFESVHTTDSVDAEINWRLAALAANLNETAHAVDSADDNLTAVNNHLKLKIIANHGSKRAKETAIPESLEPVIDDFNYYADQAPDLSQSTAVAVRMEFLRAQMGKATNINIEPAEDLPELQIQAMNQFDKLEVIDPRYFRGTVQVFWRGDEQKPEGLPEGYSQEEKAFRVLYIALPPKAYSDEAQLDTGILIPQSFHGGKWHSRTPITAEYFLTKIPALPVDFIYHGNFLPLGRAEFSLEVSHKEGRTLLDILGSMHTEPKYFVNDDVALRYVRPMNDHVESFRIVREGKEQSVIHEMIYNDALSAGHLAVAKLAEFTAEEFLDEGYRNDTLKKLAAVKGFYPIQSIDGKAILASVEQGHQPMATGKPMIPAAAAPQLIKKEDLVKLKRNLLKKLNIPERHRTKKLETFKQMQRRLQRRNRQLQRNEVYASQQKVQQQKREERDMELETLLGVRIVENNPVTHAMLNTGRLTGRTVHAFKHAVRLYTHIGSRSDALLRVRLRQHNRATMALVNMGRRTQKLINAWNETMENKKQDHDWAKDADAIRANWATQPTKIRPDQSL